MTTFQHLPESDYYRMETLIPGSAVDTFESIRDLGVGSVTEGVWQVLSVRKWYDDAHRIGNLLVAVSPEAVEPLALPDFTVDEERPHTKVTVNVGSTVKEYLDTYATGEPTDLVAMWGSSARFYSGVMERQVLGQKFYRITPSLRVAEVTFTDAFGESAEPPAAAPGTIRGFLRGLRRDGENK